MAHRHDDAARVLAIHATPQFADGHDGQIDSVFLRQTLLEEGDDTGVGSLALARLADDVRVNQIHASLPHPACA